jgi:hypothetical protein
MTISFDTNILLNYYQNRAGIPVTGTSGVTSPSKKVAPTPPWQDAATSSTAAVKSALAGHKLIDENAAQLDLAGASADYRKLFALYQGLNTLSGLVDGAQAKNVSPQDLRRLQATFEKGLAEVSKYVDTASFEKLRLTQGAVATSAKTTAGVAKAKTEYVTAPLVTGSSGDLVAAFAGDVKFTIKAKGVNVTKTVDVDLTDMGSTPRTLANVINFINGELQDAGVVSRFGTQRIPAVPKTTTAGGKTITLPAGPDQWAMKVKVDTGETISFSAPQTAGAVYLAQSAGDPDPDKKPSTADGVTQRELLKFQTDTTVVAGPPQPSGSANWVDGRIFSKALGPEVQAVRDTKVGADGSVYMLADITGTNNGQAIKGEQDVALLKYDSAGNLIYSRTLGAADEASGLGLAISTDGQVAVAGSLKGALGGATNSPLNSGPTSEYADSFVTLYDTSGQEVWTQRRGARLDDEASELAFGADGTVYVAGRSKSPVAGATAIGGWDSYVEAFKADTTGKVKALFTQSFGTAGTDRPAGMVLDGSSLVVAAVEDGHAVLRRFDVSGAAPTLTATRDLGDLQGGDIAGLALDGGQVVIAGATRNAALAAGAVTNAHAGGMDAFAARLDADLTADPADAIAYYGGAGDDRATALAVANGKVWITGSAGTDLPNQAPAGVKDGFLASLDVAGGTVDWSRRFTAKDRQAAPTAIAVDPNGASVLDRLGLPQGTLQMSGSQRITAATALRAGDQFTISVGSGLSGKVTIEEKDTLETLANKVRRAAGFNIKVDIVTADGARRLQFKPLNGRSTVEIGAGAADRDALATLGLTPGVLRETTVNDDRKLVPADGKSQIYGLSLETDLNLSSANQIKHAAAEIATAMGVIRTAYKDLVTAATPKSALTQGQAVTGTVPAYLTSQIANYQAALSRLTGGG